MNPSDPVPDIMHRTMCNLRYIETRATSDGPYEVTQLINSFLGAFAHPWEEYKPSLCKTTLDEAHKRGWPELKNERAEGNGPTSLGDLLRLVRNAFAHGHIRFIPGPNNEIESIQFWNNNRRRSRTWETTLTVSDLRRFLDCFVKLADEIHAERNRGKSHSP